MDTAMPIVGDSSQKVGVTSRKRSRDETPQLGEGFSRPKAASKTSKKDKKSSKKSKSKKHRKHRKSSSSSSSSDSKSAGADSDSSESVFRVASGCSGRPSQSRMMDWAKRHPGRLTCRNLQKMEDMVQGESTSGRERRRLRRPSHII